MRKETNMKLTWEVSASPWIGKDKKLEFVMLFPLSLCFVVFPEFLDCRLLLLGICYVILGHWGSFIYFGFSALIVKHWFMWVNFQGQGQLACFKLWSCLECLFADYNAWDGFLQLSKFLSCSTNRASLECLRCSARSFCFKCIGERYFILDLALPLVAYLFGYWHERSYC